MANVIIIRPISESWSGELYKRALSIPHGPLTLSAHLIDKGYVKSAHDISLGGLLVAISKMCIRGNKGIKINKSKKLINEIEYFFAEDQGRYLIEVNKEDLKEVTKILNKNSIHHEELGIITQNDMIINEKTKVTIDELKSYYTNWLSKFMS